MNQYMSALLRYWRTYNSKLNIIPQAHRDPLALLNTQFPQAPCQCITPRIQLLIRHTLLLGARNDGGSVSELRDDGCKVLWDRLLQKRWLISRRTRQSIIGRSYGRVEGK